MDFGYYTEATYGFYFAASVAATIWVARTLFRNGRVFLVDAFRGNEEIADSVNHLLVVGFYLINVGYVTLALKHGDKPNSLVQSIEFFSTKIGLVLLVLGTMHFFNLACLSVIRKRGTQTPCPTGGGRKKDHLPSRVVGQAEPPMPIPGDAQPPI